MFKFSIDDQNVYAIGDDIEDIKVNWFSDEPLNLMTQHLAQVYGEVLHIASELGIDERDINALAFMYLDEHYPENVSTFIKKRIRELSYRYDITKVEE